MLPENKKSLEEKFSGYKEATSVEFEKELVPGIPERYEGYVVIDKEGELHVYAKHWLEEFEFEDLTEHFSEDEMVELMFDL